MNSTAYRSYGKKIQRSLLAAILNLSAMSIVAVPQQQPQGSKDNPVPSLQCEAFYSTAAQLYSIRNYQEALPLFQLVTSTNPRHAEAWVLGGNCARELGHPQDAVKAYQQALSIQPDCELAYENLGVAYLRLEQFEQAVAASQHAIRLNPSLPYPYSNIGVAYARLGHHKKAIEFYRRALQIQPNLVDTLVNLGLNHALLGQNSNAIRAFNQAIRLRPDDAEAHSHLIACYWNKGERILALQELQILKTLSPTLAQQISESLADTYILDARTQSKEKKQSSPEKSLLNTANSPPHEK
jgi:tetratricopeptide (TPR) repeat protein